MTRAVVAHALLAAGLVACNDSSAPGTHISLGVPQLRTPATGTVIPQNDSTTGCTYSPTHGYGFQIPFRWTAVPGADRYHLKYNHLGASIPALDTIVADTADSEVDCHTYVIASNLRDWIWTVAAGKDSNVDGAWAVPDTFEYAPFALLPAPQLLTPAPGSVIAQNDPSTGCTYFPSVGYGFQIFFSWRAVPGAAWYHLKSDHLGASIPAVDTIVADTAVLRVKCGAYPTYLQDWGWTAAAISDSGGVGTWAPRSAFEFAPLVLP